MPTGGRNVAEERIFLPFTGYCGRNGRLCLFPIYCPISVSEWLSDAVDERKTRLRGIDFHEVTHTI